MEYRLNKYISSSGLCSRREADRYIEQGNVTINGKKASLGDRVLPGQEVKVNGLLIETDIKPVYIAFNKPVGVVTTTDTHDKENIVDYISHEQRVFPIGRLDKDSQGLILLTNDGDIVNKILRAGNNHKKEYLVTVNKPITPEFLEGMAGGVPILDRVTRKCDIKMMTPNVFHITLIQGLNRQIRRMCEYFGYEVTKLERIQIMNIKLGHLKQGNWRDLTEDELGTLFDMIEDSEGTAAPKKSATKKSPAKRSSSLRAPRTGTARAHAAAMEAVAAEKGGRHTHGRKKSTTAKPYTDKVADEETGGPVKKYGYKGKLDKETYEPGRKPGHRGIQNPEGKSSKKKSARGGRPGTGGRRGNSAKNVAAAAKGAGASGGRKTKR